MAAAGAPHPGDPSLRHAVAGSGRFVPCCRLRLYGVLGVCGVVGNLDF